MKYINKITVYLLSAFALLVTSCSSSETQVVEPNTALINVVVSKPSQNRNTSNIEVTGQVEAAHAANVSTRIMGYITKVYVKTGDRVKAGQMLFTINSTDIQAKKAQVEAGIKQAEAALHVAQKDFDRYTLLYKQNSASAKEVEQINLQYQSAKANFESAKAMQSEVVAQMTYANVVAPFSGVVTQKLADEGSLANPGMPIVIIEQTGSLQVSAMVPESAVVGTKLGSDANVIVSSANTSFTGKITQVNPSSQLTGGQYIIKISIPTNITSKILAGMYATVTIQNKTDIKIDTTTSNGILVPITAIVNRDQLTGIYTVGSQNTALLRWVRLGKTIGGNVELLSGLSKDESYILSAEGNLFNGAKLKIK